jgi:4-amino-4-deoxy-L-arabinose transferase-like glycosyltransferase
MGIDKTPARSFWLLALLFVVIVVVDCIWFQLDQRPPIWDMAVHLATGLDFYRAFQHFSFSVDFLKSLILLGQFYPTLFPAMMGLFFAIFHPSPYVGPAANFIPLAVLIWATYRIGKKLFSDSVGVLAAFVVTTYPIMAWLVREALLDFTLVATVALAAWIYLESDNFSKLGPSLIYGAAVALGFLAKHGFLFYGFTLAVFAFYELATRTESPLQQRAIRFRNMMGAHSLGVAVAAIWYIPHSKDVREYFLINSHMHYVLKQPEFMTAPSLLYTLDALTSTQMLFIPFVLLMFALIVSVRHFARRALILYFGGFGSLVIMTFTVMHREVRMSVASLPFLAVLTAAGILELRSVRWKKALVSLLVVSALVEFEMITFGWPQWPDKVTLWKSRALEINLFERRYAGQVGPPAREDWKIESILERVAADAAQKTIRAPRLGVVPDVTRFNHFDFVLFSKLDSVPVGAERLSTLVNGDIPVQLDYLVLKSGDQGEPGTTQANPAIQQFLREHPGRFSAVATFDLPDGSLATLFRQLREQDRQP